jgi:tRNA(Ile)-lysidine synthase
VLSLIQTTIARYNMLPVGARMIVAVSGGADSVALLHMLRELVPESLVGVAHFNHQLRGAESDGDQRFVAALSQSLGLRFHCAASAVGAGNLEQNARTHRREFFRSLVERGLADRIALGHTLDDQSETVLFRILRGSGTSGLAGILPVTAEGIIRPLLKVPRSDVRDYLEQHRLAWREDSSNASPQFARNRIRQTLLPELVKHWNPRIVATLAHLADVAYQEEVWWAGEVARHEGALSGGPGWVEIFAPALAALPQALVRRLTRQAIRRAKADLRGIDYRHIGEVVDLALAPKGSAKSVIPGLTAVRSFDWLLLRGPLGPMPPQPKRLSGPGTHLWEPAKCMIQLSIDNPLQRPDAYDTLELELRGWRAGDQYQPLGRKHPVKLQELFQKARVPSWRRAAWPIITGRGKILWAKEFGPGVEGRGLLFREIPITAESFSPKVSS